MVGSVPFQLAHSSVLELRFSQIITAERIRALKLVNAGGKLNQVAERKAREIADRRMAEELSDGSIVERHARDTLRLLHSHCADPQFRASSEELLRQIVVMSWGAFETISNDLTRLIINLRPILVRKLLMGRPYKDLVTARTLFDGLESAQFNLSSGMGDFLSDLASLDSIEKIQANAHSLFQSSALDKVLKNDRLWRIAQQRHLIVHRLSVVDARYLERTGDKTEIGEKLVFDSNYVEESVAFVRDIGCLMYEAACETLSS